MKAEIEKLIQEHDEYQEKYLTRNVKLSNLIFSVARKIDADRNYEYRKNDFDWFQINDGTVEVGYEDGSTIEFPIEFLWDVDRLNKHIKKINKL